MTTESSLEQESTTQKDAEELLIYAWDHGQFSAGFNKPLSAQVNAALCIICKKLASEHAERGND